jgi:hypothetical protein
VADLETVTIPAVEVLSTGGPVHGQGSPPEGDYWTRDQLEAMAEAARELAAEIRAPNKIGHSDVQSLLRNSELAAPTPGEMPAVGWLDGSTAQVVDGGDGVDAVLVMDAKAVPKQFAQLVNAGAYRTRSAELSRITSQVTQKTYDWVVTGLAWLGAKLPAVQTLEDVVALYERAELDPPENVRAYVVYAAGETIVWAPDSSFRSLQDDVFEALNGPPTGGMNEPRFWVADIALTGDAALVCDYYDSGDDGYIVPFSRDDAGEVTISPSSDWTSVEQGWVKTAKEYARKNGRPAESRAMELTLTDEQVTTVREQLGLDADAELTPDVIAEAAEARANELAERDEKIAELEQAASERKNEAKDADSRINELETRVEASEKRSFEMERDTDLEAAVRAGKIDPADLDEWRKDYEESQAGTRRVLERLKPDPDLVRELGRDDADGEDAQSDEQYQRDFERRHGMKARV